MKFTIPLALFLLISGMTAAGIVNANPDPKGEPWIAGGLSIPENFDRSGLKFIEIRTELKKELPSRVDNSLHKFFRPVFNQVGGSCSQAAGVGYTFTYEINRLRNLASNSITTQYPTHFTYNFLNEGSGEIGSWWGDGWDIIQSVGIMNVEEYGGHFATGGNSRWISGIDEWSSAHFNRVESYNAIDVGTPEGLNTLKNWFDNHLEGSPYGGLAVFAAGATGYHGTTLAAGTHEAGKRVITKWGTEVNHAMTYVGYDDSVRFDYNGDGRFTNDVDLNGDRIIDMRDWEIGAVIVANSWGTSFGNGGFIYQMYKLLAEPYENGGIFLSFADVVHPVMTPEPRWALEVKMKHDRRNTYKISAGYSNDIYQQSPDLTVSYPFMNFQGGDYYPQGGRSEFDKYIDFSIDVTEMLKEFDTSVPFRAYLIVDEIDTGNRYEGEIISVTLVDQNTGKRYYDPSLSLPVVNNGRTVYPVTVDRNTFVPEGLTAFGGDGIVRLEWPENTSKTTYFESYSIYRDGELYQSGLGGNSFTDEDVINGRLYTYKLSAVFTGTFTGEIMSLPVQVLPNKPSTLPYFADFEDGAQGWTIKGDLSGWLIGNSSYSSEYCDYTGNSSSFILANPDLAGESTVVRDYAVTPVFNISNFDNIQLEFDYILNNALDYDYFADIFVSYRTGLDKEWAVLEKLPYTTSWSNKTIFVPEEAVLSNFTQFAFFIEDYYKWSMGGGGIDNVRITGNFSTSAPQINSYLPAEPTFSISDLEPVSFSVEVYDEDTGISELNFKWHVNGELKQEGGSEFNKTFGEQGDYTVKVTVSDKYDEVSNEWTVTQTDIEENLPLTTKLYQNYPNPFNPSTEIRFDNASENFTSMQIFNSNGQLVRELLNRKLKPGSYSVNWDGRDNSGVALSSGIYYCTLISGDYTKTFKMMLFK